MAVTTKQFNDELAEVLRFATELDLSAVELTSGALHRRVGDYPGSNHRMLMCCNAMRQAMKPDDEIASAPPNGNGASLRIRFRLPR